MESKIKGAIQRIINEKYAQGEVFPCANSIDVARLLKMDHKEVEIIASNIEDILTYKTFGETYYEI